MLDNLSLHIGTYIIGLKQWVTYLLHIIDVSTDIKHVAPHAIIKIITNWVFVQTTTNQEIVPTANSN